MFPQDVPEQTELSYSQVTVFQQCRFRYQQKYIVRRLRQDQRTSFYHTIGRSVHRALADIFAPAPPGREPVDLEKKLHEKWSSEGFANRSDEERWFARCLNRLERFVAVQNPVGETLLVETNFKDSLGRLLITSTVDRLDRKAAGTARIVDYKYGEPEVEPQIVENGLQWIFHYLAAQKTIRQVYSLEIDEVTFCFLDAGENVQIEITPELVQRGIQKLEKLAGEIAGEKVFSPTLNKFCTDCKFDIICPMVADLKRRGIRLEDEVAGL